MGGDLRGAMPGMQHDEHGMGAMPGMEHGGHEMGGMHMQGCVFRAKSATD